jgi:hypothetical protein
MAPRMQGKTEATFEIAIRARQSAERSWSFEFWCDVASTFRRGPGTRLEFQNTVRAGKFASVNEKKHLDSTGCTHLEPISTFGASKHLDITAGSLDKVQYDAGRCRSIPITVVSADISLIRSGHSLSISFDASW